MHIRPFISSTDYDLLDARAEIISYVRYLGYRPNVFENHDFFDSVEDFGRHDKCVTEVANSDVLVLLIDKRFGGKYIGNIYNDRPAGFDDIEMSICWAETRKALELNKPIRIFIRDKTWEARNEYNVLKSSGKLPKKINANKKIGWAEPSVYRFIDYLQADQRCVRQLFTNSTDLKTKVGMSLDSLFGRAHHRIVTKFNSAFIQASEIQDLLSDLYSCHVGDIWLFNNDLELIKNEYLFDSIYINILKPKLRDGTIKSIKIILRADKFLEFFNPLNEQRSILLNNLSKMEETVGKIQIALLESFDKNAPTMDLENLTFYTIDRNLSNPDTVCLIRKETRPYTTNGPTKIQLDDLVTMCRRHEVPVFFERAKDAVQSYFDVTGNKQLLQHFGSLNIEINKRNNEQYFKLKSLG